MKKALKDENRLNFRRQLKIIRWVVVLLVLVMVGVVLGTFIFSMNDECSGRGTFEGWRTYAPFRDTIRNSYNEWIRTTDSIDGVIDFDLVLRDPENPSAFLPIYDSGDHLHPSKEGYQRMAQEVTKSILK